MISQDYAFMFMEAEHGRLWTNRICFLNALRWIEQWLNVHIIEIWILQDYSADKFDTVLGSRGTFKRSTIVFLFKIIVRNVK